MAAELKIIRFFEAPVETVWKFWSKPLYFKKWWGPKDFTAPVIRVDFKKGGKYVCCMRGPDKKNYWSTGKYKEIVELKKIVCTDSFADKTGKVVPASYYGMPGDWPKELLVTVLFEQKGKRTKMTLIHDGVPKKIMPMCKIGWEQSFDKLSKNL